MEPATLAAKYDAIGEKYGTRYRDPQWWADRQAALVLGWGRAIEPGDSVLEFGCADGRLLEKLAVAGCRISAVDLSGQMVSLARARLEARGLSGDLRSGNLDEHFIDQNVDCVIALMANFFYYSRDPGAALRRFYKAARKKVLVDINPRTCPIPRGMDMLKKAGFVRVSWRPFFVPQKVRVGAFGRMALSAAEAAPLLRSAVLRYKFSAVLKGEKP